jgi:hypothetical protein
VEGAPEDPSNVTESVNAGVIRIVCGANASYTDAAGGVWSADHGFRGGTALARSTSTPIGGTPDPTLYASERWGASSYAFALPNGSYAVTLKFAETYVDGPRQREFDVVINGRRVLTNFDIYAAAGGKLRAVDEQFAIPVTDGSLRIDLVAGAIQSPKIDAIEVLPTASVATATTTEAPFTQLRAQVPGRIAAVNYDLGGEGIAYHEASSHNQGGLYRPNEAIGIKHGGDTDGYVVGWNETGRWLKYGAYVAASGTYTLRARVASADDGGTFHLESDGRDVSGPIAVPQTGAWDDGAWTTVTKSVALTEGPHVLRLVVDAQWFDLEAIDLELEPSATATPPPDVTTTASLFGMVWNEIAHQPTFPVGVMRLWDVGTGWDALNPSPGTYVWTVVLDVRRRTQRVRRSRHS